MPKIEFELRYKINEDELNKIKKQLEETEYILSNKVNQKDIVFIKGENIVRIRKEGEKASLDYKRRIDETKWEEYSIKINRDEIPTAVRIIQKFVPFNKIIEKNREIYEKDGTIICIDHMKCLGLFIEIEGESDKCYEVAKKLNLENKEIAKPYGLYYDELYKKGYIRYNLEEVMVEFV